MRVGKPSTSGGVETDAPPLSHTAFDAFPLVVTSILSILIRFPEAITHESFSGHWRASFYLP